MKSFVCLKMGQNFGCCDFILKCIGNLSFNYSRAWLVVKDICMLIQVYNQTSSGEIRVVWIKSQLYTLCSLYMWAQNLTST